MDELLGRWLSSNEPQITLFEDDDEIKVQRDQQILLISAQLTHHRVDKKTLEAWMRLGQASLRHFQGALAQEAINGHLWLLQKLPSDGALTHLVTKLETLLNQRDTWRAMAVRLARPTQKLTPTSLRSLPH
ncbi:type III secretion protein [Pseudomonas sp. ADAK18]|uniref:type III secretion protein n=1 Tax=Pseudomonas sp. ADAK18 TaxID=2730848 RepID=UPI0014637FD7|nr:type III secretion protein [Pseudomonas sp. ADAK18]QJI27342.1 type III secretion protein [Pseudomonas sp. ADAK18]